MNLSKTIPVLAAAALTVLCASVSSAQAHDHDHFGHGGFGAEVVIGGSPYYGYSPYYAPAPAYYYTPAPAYYYPSAQVYTTYAYPPPAPTDHYYSSEDNRYCREYLHTIMIDGSPHQGYGHACRQPDGTWQIID